MYKNHAEIQTESRKLLLHKDSEDTLKHADVRGYSSCFPYSCPLLVSVVPSAVRNTLFHSLLLYGSEIDIMEDSDCKLSFTNDVTQSKRRIIDMITCARS